MLDKSDLLRIVAAEVDHKNLEAKADAKANRQSQPKDTTWKKVLKWFNEATLDKYGVACAVGDAYKLKATGDKILRTFGGNLERVEAVVKYYVTFYEELPFIKVDRFPRPLFSSIAPFASQILEYMERRGEIVAQAECAQIDSLTSSNEITIKDAF